MRKVAEACAVDNVGCVSADRGASVRDWSAVDRAGSRRAPFTPAGQRLADSISIPRRTRDGAARPRHRHRSRFRMPAVNVDSTEKLAHEFTAALDADGPTVIVVPTKPQAAHLG